MPCLPGLARLAPSSQFVAPETIAVAAIDGATNIAVQDLCPGRMVEHVGLIFDSVALGIVLDALSHPGPADQARIGASHCAELYARGIDPAVASVGIATLYANAFAAIPAAHQVDAEPPLLPYARS